MARAHAANACVQSDSIKGLAQSIAKPAYHQAADSGARASPRRAHPDHRLPDHHLPRRLRPGGRSEPAEARGDQARPGGDRRHAGRAHRPPRLRPGRIAPPLSNACKLCCPASFRPGASPPAGMSSSPAPTSACSPALPIEAAIGETDRHSRHHQRGAAAGRAGPASRPSTDITLPNGSGALAIQRIDQGRCPARSSSSRKASIRCGARTRRCR